ncbi:MAG: PLP-dependent aminotransferase family protein [Pseudomonadota bacterium]
MKPYVAIADEIAKRIATGEMALGSRLPPQRSFAYERGIAVSTASRVYDELRRRGLVTGEVGRGTYVSNRFAPLDPSMQEPSGTGIDLEIVFRLAPETHELIARSSAGFFKSGLSRDDLGPSAVRKSSDVMDVFADLTSETGHKVSSQDLLLTGNGKQAIAAAFCALAPRGGRLAVEELTYPFAIAVARRFGIELLPIPVDSEGMDPTALNERVEGGIDGIYLQPTLQSPMVLTMGSARRQAIAAILKHHNVAAIEDRIYGFLKPVKPLAAYAPDHVIQIDSLSKRLMPGLSLGLITSPERFRDALAGAIRAGGWMAPSLSVAIARHWVEEGLVSEIEASKRSDAQAMFKIARKTFAGLDYRSAPEALHGWLSLPTTWRAQSFAEQCAQLGIAVAPGRAFAVGKGVAPSGVRIAYSASDLATWAHALKEVAQLASSKG